MHSIELTPTVLWVLDPVVGLRHGAQERDEIPILFALIFIERHDTSIGARAMTRAPV